MKLSVLHISDLHRDPKNPIRNSVLLDSLENDQRHYCEEESPKVRPPDIVIVSGDIIHGIDPDVAEPEKELHQQYQEALAFLTQLTDRFVGGDRDRVVIVPGNHDVSSYHFQKSLQKIVIAPGRKKDLLTQLFSPNSLLRWSWSDFELYEIVDQDTYNQRLSAFAEFYAAFYKGARKYDIDPSKQYDIFDFPNFNLTIAGFSSCFNNDLCNRQGAIHPECIADVGTKLRHPDYNGRLRVAVWHHNAEGSPTQSDYMDPDLIQNLIDRGFSLGFHGHQHKPQFLDTRFRYGVERGITVISAGTLCGWAAVRFGRSYNVVELETQNTTGYLHVREMQNPDFSLPIWGRRSLPPNTSAFYKFHFDQPPPPIVRSDLSTTSLVEARRLYEAGEFQKSAEILVRIAASDSLARPLLLDCYLKLHDMASIITRFYPPLSNVEAIHVMDALWAEGKYDRLKEVLKLPLIEKSDDPSVIDIRKKYATRVDK